MNYKCTLFTQHRIRTTNKMKKKTTPHLQNSFKNLIEKTQKEAISISLIYIGITAHFPGRVRTLQ